MRRRSLFNDDKAVEHTFIGAFSVNVVRNLLSQRAYDLTVLKLVNEFLTFVALAIGSKAEVVFFVFRYQ